ncbi:MAG: hypothetical protein COA97_04600 [Flavobacteriales bacterium]|nr:MAG: hypothetical protein COA97_04600 [Flavobacteriales bacterium]
MRLGQLARQLDIKSEKIVSFLAKEKEITIKEHPNSKVEDDLIDIITTHFSPAVEDNVVIEEKEPVSKEEEPTLEEKVEPEHIETVKVSVPQELKIVGKIDLPNKKEINIEVDGVVYDQETLDNKKKEELKEERELKAIEKEEKRKEDEERKAKAREQRKVEQERQAMLETEKHNLLSKEEERKNALILKEQQEREEKLEEKRKEKQKEHYAQKHAGTTSTPSKKKIKKTVVAEEEKIEIQVQKEEVAKLSGFKKFMKWLNT